ncbi:hypothetical protein HX857_20655 [Pseudomonas gingeri]|uniref:hypothetical protein n=1 Tax=Pseudomonas gingeri TaxID=117681 RepID=UPI0015A4BEF3|nr:hypothetical protein [Pseudomonas gingeri]NWE45649.1 hypothetical protein [Pseudomonas gingeri]NWE71115.1 hypothetical protein [Pseudomonas gingeri]
MEHRLFDRDVIDSVIALPTLQFFLGDPHIRGVDQVAEWLRVAVMSYTGYQSNEMDFQQVELLPSSHVSSAEKTLIP